MTTREDLLNTPLDSGVRSLILLAAVMPETCDLQRLVAYDYLLVHSADVNGPESLHAPSPFRSGELVVRRKLVERGVELIVAKGLVMRSYDSDGISYGATDIATKFLEYFDSDYVERARKVACWIHKEFSFIPDSDLQNLMFDNIGRWGTEFTNDPLLDEDRL